MLYIWSHRAYWQTPGQIEGYKLLTESHGNNCLTSDHRLCVGKEIARLFQMLHDHNMIQNDVRDEDVYVQNLDGVMK